MHNRFFMGWTMPKNSKHTLGERAYHALREKVMTLESGTYLSARGFADEIGMSYTPVREAFLRLQREGSLRQVPNVGFFVETMDLNDILQVYQVRECIEPFVLNKVFPLFLPQHIHQMRSLSDMQKEALQAGDIVQYMRLDIALHEVVLDLYANKHLKNLYHSIREHYMFCSQKIGVTHHPDAIAEHSEWIDAIEAKDREVALRLTVEHIENAKQRMKDGYINVI